MAKKIKDMAASVRERLRTKATENGEDFQSVLVRYGAERFLYRLSKSDHSARFLLKGAALFRLWFDQPHRPTRDIDLLGFGANDIPTIERAIKDICSIQFDDGLQFQPDSVKGEVIREDLNYQGVRVKCTAKLANIVIPIQVDVGIGDAVTPGPERADYPTLLEFPAPNLRVYPKETVIAEKFEAMVRFGMANGRMKDFWDLRYMIAEFEFEAATLQAAIQMTFGSRGTKLPTSSPIALTDDFVRDRAVRGRWSGFTDRNNLERYTDLGEVIASLRNFFVPIIETGSAPFTNLRWNRSVWK